MTENIELLFKFVSQGAEQLDRAASSIEKVTSGSQKTGHHLQAMERDLANVSREVEKSGRSFDGLGDNIRSGLGSPLHSGIGALENLLTKLGPVGIGVTAVGVGLGVVGEQAFSLVARMGAAAEQTVNLADRLGIAVGQAERLQVEAEIAGVNIGALEGASRMLAAALEDQTGQGEKTANGLRKLGVSTVTVGGQQRELGQVLLDVLDKLAAVDNDANRVFLAQQVLPRGAAKELIPLIKNYVDLKRAMNALGVGLQEDVTKNLANADDEIGKMRASWDLFKKSLAGKIAPIVIPVVVAATKEMAGNGVTRSPDMIGPVASSTASVATSWLIPGSTLETLDIRSMLAGKDTSGERAWQIIQQDLRRGTSASDAFREARKTTQDGMKRQLEQVKREMAELESVLSSGNMGGSAFAIKKAEFDSLETKRRELETKIERAGKKQDDETIKLSDLYAKNKPERQAPPSLYSIAERGQRLGNVLGGLNADGSFTASPVENSGLAQQQKGFADGLLAAMKLRDDLAQRTADTELNAAIRLLELMDNEYESAARIRDLKLATAKDSVESLQAELDYTVRIEEIERRRMEKYKDTAGRVWDSLKAGGGGGLRDMFTGQLDILQRQIFVNASAGIFQRAGGLFGQIGEASGLGGLLEGTIFDPKNAQKPLDQNTKSIDRLRTSVDKLTAKISGGSAGNLPGLSSLPGIESISNDLQAFAAGKDNSLLGKAGQKIFGSNAGKSVSAVLGGAGSLFSAGLFAGLGHGSVNLGDGKATTADALGTSWRVGNIAASGALVGLGTLGVVSGLREGGVSGTATAVGSALGIASAVPGPQQPFLQAAAMVAGLVKGLLPNPKESFDRDQANTLNSRRYTGPEAQNRTYDFTTGGDVDYDWRGRVRVVNQRTVVVNINAMDYESMASRGQDIAKIVAEATVSGKSPEMKFAINQEVFPGYSG